MDEKRLTGVRRVRTSKTVVPKVPSLPKLHCRAPLVTTELSKPIFKSTVGHEFDLSRPIEDEIFTKYNALHDPHTKAFFHRPSMYRKLQKHGFVTSDMKVACSLKEYNAYREFMEYESMKLGKQQEEKTEKEKRALEKAVVDDKEVNPIDKEREEKSKKFFREQEKKVTLHQNQMRRLQLREQQERLKMMEEKKLLRERNEIRREAEREQRHLAKLQQQHQEAVEKRHRMHSSENQMLVRMLHLQHTRQSHRLQKIRELESKWQAYDDHVHKAREEVKERKTRAKEEKEKKRRKRKRLVELMKAKKEERRKRLHEQTFHQAEDLKKQADHHEQLWREKKEHEVIAWREKIHREQDHWQHHIHHQMEVCKNEHQKHMDMLLHTSYLPKCATPFSASKWVGSSMSAKCSTDVTTTNQHQKSGKKSRDVLKPKRKSVAFQQNVSVHIIEEYEPDFDESVNKVEPTTKETSGDPASRNGSNTSVVTDEEPQVVDKEEDREGESQKDDVTDLEEIQEAPDCP